MGETEFRSAGSLQKPGPIGRSVRITTGLLCFYLLYQTIQGYTGIVSSEFPAVVSLWLGVLFCFHGLPHILNVGYARNWGMWPRWGSLGIALVASALSYLQKGSFWGPEIGLVVFLLMFFVLVHLAPTLTLAGIIATPG